MAKVLVLGRGSVRTVMKAWVEAGHLDPLNVQVGGTGGGVVTAKYMRTRVRGAGIS